MDEKMSAANGRQRFRALGRIELYLHIRNKVKFYNNVGLTAQYMLSTQVIEKYGGLQSVIFVALNSVINKHPAMGVSIEDESATSAIYVSLDTIDLRKVVKFITISGDQKFIEDEHQEGFDNLEELPLWRVVVAEHPDKEPEDQKVAETGFDVAFIFHHAMGDGLSGASFHLTFLDALNELGPTEPGSIPSTSNVVKPPRLQLPPSMEEARCWPLSLLFIVGEIFKAFVLSDKDPKRWSGPPITFSSDSPPKTRLLTHIVSASDAAKVAQRCRENKTSVTALLTLLIARHLSNAYPKYTRFPASLATSLRKFTGTDARQMTNQYSGVTVPCSTRNESGYVSCKYIDWDVIRSCKAVIDNGVKSPSNQITIMLKFLSDYRDFFLKKIGKEKSHSFELSNIGVLDGRLDKDGVAKFRQVVFSQSANVTEAPLDFSVATVKGGNMIISLTWQEGIVEEDKAKQIMEGLATELHLHSMEYDLERRVP